MLFGSLFSGCGGMDGGLEDAGHRCAWQVEIDPQRRHVLRHHWPGVPKFGDITEISTDELAAVHLIAGGSPCQDLSVAGTREGLDGERSGLFHEYVRIVDSQPSAWVLCENVDGALSSNGGMDFSIILRELCGTWFEPRPDGWRSSGFCVGPKRWLVWRVLDSEYFGVPQRRYRVFLVGGPRDGACAPEVLLEPDCLPGNPPPSREAGAGVAGSLTAGAEGRGWRVGADEAAAGLSIPVAFGRNNTTGALSTSACLTNHPGRYDFESETVIVTPYRLAQITSRENRANPQPGDPAPVLNGDPRLAIAYQCHGSNVGPIGTLRKHGSVAGVPFTVVANAVTASYGVRRLTPRECERLQGYPDDHTRYGTRENGKTYELKDSPRYAMIGDGVTRNVAAWIGRRLARALRETPRAHTSRR